MHYAALAYAPGANVPDLEARLPVPHLESDPNESVRVSTRFHLDTRVPLVVFCPGAEYGVAKRWHVERLDRCRQRVRLR